MWKNRALVAWAMTGVWGVACLGADSGAKTGSARAAWIDQANQRIEQHRKGDFVVTIEDEGGRAISGAQVEVDQTRHHFFFGTAVNGFPSVTGDADGKGSRSAEYLGFIEKHFNIIVNENDLKFTRVEPERDKVDFSRADAWADWAKARGIAVRGHCLFWAKFKMVQEWLKKLPEAQRREEAIEHLTETVKHFKGRVYSWDVNNEMLNGNYYQRNVGADLRPDMFKMAHELDPAALLFVNEYGVPADGQVADKLVSLVRGLQKNGAPVLAVGLQEHALHKMVLAEGTKGFTPETFIANLEKVAALDLPIHFTEITCREKDETAKAAKLEALFRIAFSQPKVQAILLWGFYGKNHWKGEEATIVNEDGSLKPSGKRVLHLMEDLWMTHNLKATTDEAGVVRFRGFFGTYKLTVNGRTAEVTLAPGATEAKAVLR